MSSKETPQGRAERLAAQLRSNLQRRKAQSRALAAQPARALDAQPVRALDAQPARALAAQPDHASPEGAGPLDSPNAAPPHNSP